MVECDAVVSGSNVGIVGGMFGELVRVLARDSLLLVGCTIDPVHPLFYSYNISVSFWKVTEWISCFWRNNIFIFEPFRRKSVYAPKQT